MPLSGLEIKACLVQVKKYVGQPEYRFQLSEWTSKEITILNNYYDQNWIRQCTAVNCLYSYLLKPFSINMLYLHKEREQYRQS